jgi:hypothetical protein
MLGIASYGTHSTNEIIENSKGIEGTLAIRQAYEGRYRRYFKTGFVIEAFKHLIESFKKGRTIKDINFL